MQLRLLLCGCLALAAQAFVPVPAARSLQLSAQQPAISMTAATKATRTNRRRREYNKMYKSEMRTAIRKVLESSKAGDYSDAFPKLSTAMSIIDKNVKRGIVHKNTAARKKSQLTLKVKALESPAAPAEEAVEA